MFPTECFLTYTLPGDSEPTTQRWHETTLPAPGDRLFIWRAKPTHLQAHKEAIRYRIEHRAWQVFDTHAVLNLYLEQA